MASEPKPWGIAPPGTKFEFELAGITTYTSTGNLVERDITLEGVSDQMLRLAEIAYNPPRYWIGSRGNRIEWDLNYKDPSMETTTELAALPERAPMKDVQVMDVEYAALAKQLGIEGPAILKAELEAFFVEQGIEIYDLEKVSDYMHGLARKASQENQAKGLGRVAWGWKPLRKCDRDESKQVSFSHSGGTISCTPYPHAVPFEILSTSVKAIADRFGDRVQIYVSDYEVKKPDPFVMVTAPGLPIYVFERFEEPKFRS